MRPFLCPLNPAYSVETLDINNHDAETVCSTNVCIANVWFFSNTVCAALSHAYNSAQLDLHASRAANQALAAHVEQIEGDIAAMCGLAPGGSPPGAYAIKPESVVQGPGGVWMVRPPLAPRGGRGGRGRGPAGPRRPPGNHRRPKIISISGDGHARVRSVDVQWRGEVYGRRSEEDEDDEDGLQRARRRQRVDYRALDGGPEEGYGA